jgi:hypothetical protein
VGGVRVIQMDPTEGDSQFVTCRFVNDSGVFLGTSRSGKGLMVRDGLDACKLCIELVNDGLGMSYVSLA